jgi:hypothetical protein
MYAEAVCLRADVTFVCVLCCLLGIVHVVESVLSEKVAGLTLEKTR